MNGTAYRKLSENDIGVLLQNNCHCDNWDAVEVARGFKPELIRNCTFRGTIRLGANVHIDGVREKIANYIIEDNVSIKNCESIVTARSSAFGNGVRVSVLNEPGGREVPIYNGLNAQIAYISAMYRHRPEVIASINRLVDQYAESISSPIGRIGKGTTITDCGSLTDVCTGEYAVIRGASELTNGTVNSSRKSPTRIGRDVIARNFIIADSAEVTDVAFIEKCFVGQGCKIGKGFTAVDTLFFANCDCQQGEACSVFAGPFTVTHHKSTLLISGMVSFFNAGSGSNQSNHMYRLGPMHQGVLERGCKSGSSSYILFPTRIGAFSVVNGRHYRHTDTSALPFSRLLEEGKETVIVPGIMLKSIGTARDANKWQKRDRRKGEKHDRINFEILTPYTVSNIRRGIRILEAMDPEMENPYNRALITPRGIEIGLCSYRLAVKHFVGQNLAGKLDSVAWPLQAEALPAGEAYRKWCDISGMVVPVDELRKHLETLTRMGDIEELPAALSQMELRYDEWCWNYTADILCEIFGKPWNEFTAEDYIRILEEWIDALRQQETLLRQDIVKEYDEKMQVGYGIDGDESSSAAEFAAIHGTPETNPFFESLHRENCEKIRTAERLIGLLKTAPSTL